MDFDRLTAWPHSAWFRRTLGAWPSRSPGLVERFAARVGAPLSVDGLAAEFGSLRAAADGGSTEPAAALAVALRRLRQLVLALIIERDARGWADLDEVCLTMSRMAELAVNAALAELWRELAQRHGEPVDARGQPQPLLVVAMGKLGALELNVSSDIDLVYVCRDQGSTRGNAEGRGVIGAVEFFSKLVVQLNALLSNPTEDGFVFRVDTRLRPDGDSGPLIASLPMLEQYFYAHGREWERFAWLKSRVIAQIGAPDAPADVDALTRLVRPFVMRRYLDMGGFAALRDLHRKIRTEVAQREARRAGFDVKLGRGGIREIEFIAQLFQVVRGGRDPSLTERATLPTLTAIGQRQLMPPALCAQLADDYRLLRRVEHALQYREDAQTHLLTDDPGLRSDVSGLLGSEPKELDARLDAARERVSRCFDELLQAPADAQVEAPSLVDPGAEPPDRSTDPIVARLSASVRFRAAREEVRALALRVLEQARRAAGAAQFGPLDTVLTRCADLIEQIIGRPSYLSLLERYPQALAQVLAMMGQSRWAADYLLRHPILLDELLLGSALERLDPPAWSAGLRARLHESNHGGPPDLERQMDIVREAHHAQVFRTLAQDLSGALTVETIADDLSALADQLLQISIDELWPQLRGRHRERPAFTAIGYGKLGGKELGYESDLDLVFVFEDDDPNALEVYSRLVQRLSTFLTSNTVAGRVFEIDLRLRPNGEAGLLVNRLAAFENYLFESAWVWEHQALTRARWVAGDATIGGRFEAIRRAVLSLPRDPNRLRDDVAAMRAKMHAGHPNRSQLFDLKHDSGGMVDLEFIVQYLVLAFGPTLPQLLDNAGNIALLERAGAAGLIDPSVAHRCADAYRNFRRRQHQLRLDVADLRIEPSSVADDIDAVKTLWREVFDRPRRPAV